MPIDHDAETDQYVATVRHLMREISILRAELAQADDWPATQNDQSTAIHRELANAHDALNLARVLIDW